MGAKSVAVIGAGLAGLAAASYAQRNGYNCHVFEHASQPGGVAAWWQRGDYLVDGGIHFLMANKPGSAMYRLYEELGATEGNRFPDLPLYGYYLHQPSGKSVTVTGDLDRLAADLKALAPRDGALVDDLVTGARLAQKADMGAMGFGTPPELRDWAEPLRQLWQMRGLFRLFAGRYRQPVSAYAARAESPVLRQLLCDLFLPEVPVWFLLMVLALLANGEVGLLENGSRGFVLPMEKRCQALGAQFTYKATVDEILVENGRAVGVRLADGSEHRADYVVATGDSYDTLYHLLGGRFVDKASAERHRTWALIRPTVMVSFGVARLFPGEPWLHMLRLAEPLELGEGTVDGLAVRTFNYGDVFAPAGKTMLQVMFDSDWHYWSGLREDLPAYRQAKEHVAAEVRRRLEELYPGLGAQVEMTDVATPYTTWRYTLNRQGAYMGWRPTPSALLTTLPRTLPGLGGLVTAGQWVVPGGGVPTCLYSGRQAAEILCRWDGKPFYTSLG